MRKLLSFLTVSVLLAINTGKTESYVFSTLANGTSLRWNLTNPASPIVRNGRVVYNLNPAGSADVPLAQVEAALADSFRAWEDLPNCTIGFTRGENRTETGSGNDGIFQIYWVENSTVEDGLDISGALAVARLSVFSGGGRDGEIADASLVFNGSQYQWATDGNANRVDIAEVATHEIGHAIGLSHSPIGGATMFPRTGNGSLRNRTLATDDEIGASVLYPASGYLNATATLRGVVRDQSGTPLFGANVVLTDGTGNAVASALTQRDGGYRIQGLPPGNYTAFAEPIDSSEGLFYGVSDLSSFYASAQTDFQTSADVAVALPAGETARDFSVTRGAPAFNAQLVFQPARNGFTNVGASVARGQTVTVGVGGPGIPTSAVSLSVSGPGITLTNLRAGTLSGSGGGFIIGDASISADAVPGPRNLIVTANGQRSIIAGGLEITGTGGTAPTVSVVSAADFRTSVAAESIVAAFGANLSTSRATATTTPLPTTLAGTTVQLRDSAGNTQNAPLFFVSPTQINYQIAPGLQIGPVSISVHNNGAPVATGTLQLASVAPGLFSMLGNGSGPAAALVLRIKANGTQLFEPAARLDTASNRYVTVPIDLGIAGDQVFLVLFGTGIRFRSSLIGVGVTVGGLSQPVVFAGKQGGQVGLDQINVQLSRATLGGRTGELDVSATVDGRTSNVVRVNIK